MTRYEFPIGLDPASMFGCGRFRMEDNLLERCAEEILRFGRRPLFVCDETSRSIAYDAVAASLRAEGVEPRVLVHGGFCNREDALAVAEAGKLDGVDVVLGCGGGVILDFSKCLADIAGASLITIPTSSATCCSFTPIAVCYTREGRYVSTSHFRREISAALLDTAVLSRQPPRLLAAGAMDAMAKKIEIEFWDTVPGSGGCGGGDLPSRIASAVSDAIYDSLDRNIDAAMADLGRGETTSALRDVFFASIVGAGVVSGISGGSRQVAFAHRLYYCLRTLHPERAARRTHGELVAVGLVMQLAYYGHMAEAEALASRLRGWGMPASMGDLGLPFDADELEACMEYMRGTKTMKAVGESAAPRLREALKTIFK